MAVVECARGWIVKFNKRGVIMPSPSSHHHGEHLTTALRRIGIYVSKTETGVRPDWRSLAATPFGRPSNFMDIGGDVPAARQEDIAPSEALQKSGRSVKAIRARLKGDVCVVT
ncbi:hypothetical protein PILCRDRAFT_737935 [Piloderma croceum F 1598]|uniref:Uncharacterized protein n=1 Tax=Piloderma croceum (strain F 1598) TaxID=765440 RepID=A0A0C3AFY4_PILCF|nr:hypothetical protein PILCRDRAFT_737935 [Piloderma croceum F 1598]